jgi:hypothetical protein
VKHISGLIESLLSEFEKTEFDFDKMNKAKEIYRLFMAHYDKEP